MQHPNPPQPKSSPVQEAVGSEHQESDSIATNGHERTDHQPSQNPRLRGMSHHPTDRKCVGLPGNGYKYYAQR